MSGPEQIQENLRLKRMNAENMRAQRQGGASSGALMAAAPVAPVQAPVDTGYNYSMMPNQRPGDQFRPDRSTEELCRALELENKQLKETLFQATLRLQDAERRQREAEQMAQAAR